MKYILDKRYRLRGWYKLPYGVYDTEEHEARFLDRRFYDLVMQCDAAHDIDMDALGEPEAGFMQDMLDGNVIRPARDLDFLRAEQRYHAYPARYRRELQWSITGACNFSCRHCFMSAPHAKHGVPTREELLDVVDQLAECGVLSVGITGGEPLMRDDFLDIVDALVQHGIHVKTIYTNGWLVDAALLDALEARGVRPSFQLSYDGVGYHDWLRGVPGAEERTVEAIKLLHERGYGIAVSACFHRENAHTLRETVNYLASLGVQSLKGGAMMSLGEWAKPEVARLQLSDQEAHELFERYIPEYFEDDAPLAIMLDGAFAYAPGQDFWDIGYIRESDADQEAYDLSCPVLGKAFYLGADGVVAPCMGMCDTDFAANFPNVHEQRLSEILQESKLVEFGYAMVRDVRNGNDECRSCEFVDRCAGGCRNAALMAGGNYYGVDPNACYFFKNGWEQRIRAVAQPAFEEYLRRNPLSEKAADQAIEIDCL